MNPRVRPAAVNIRLIIVLLTSAAAIAGAAYGWHRFQKESTARAALSEGNAAYAAGDWERASACLFRYLKKKNPNDIPVLKQFADATLRVRPVDPTRVLKAVEAYRRILRSVPADAEAHARLCKLFFNIGNQDELAFAAQRWKDSDAEAVEPRLWLAKAYFTQKKSGEAESELAGLITTLEAAAQKDPRHVEACVILSALVSQREIDARKPKALAWLDRAVDGHPDVADAYVHRAHFYRVRPPDANGSKGDDAALARQDLESAEKLPCLDPRTHLAVAAEWFDLGNLSRAEAALARASQVDPRTLEDYFFDLSEWTALLFEQRARFALQTRRSEGAAELADRIRSELKDQLSLRNVLGPAVDLYILAGRVDAARQALEQFRGLLPPGAQTPAVEQELAIMEATVCSAEGSFTRAIEVLKPIVARDPAASTPRRLLAAAYSSNGQSYLASRELGEYVKLAPNDTEAALRLAASLRADGDSDGAIEAARTAEKAGTSRLAATLLRLGVEVERVSPTQAETMARLEAEVSALRESEPASAELRRLAAVLQLKRGRIADAEKTLQAAIAECKDVLACIIDLADVYVTTGRDADAIALLTQQAARQPGAALWISLARVHEHGGDLPAARSALESALSTATAPTEKRQIGVLLAGQDLRNGQRESGIERLKALAGESPRDAQLRSLLLDLPEVRKDATLARRLLDEIKSAVGEQGQLYRLQQALCWLAADDWRTRSADAEASLTACLAADPRWPAAVLALGGLYERLGKTEAAEEVYRRGAVQNSGSTAIAARLLTLLERQGRFKEIPDILSRFGRSEKNMSVHRLRYAVQTGDTGEAIEELRRRLGEKPDDAASLTMLAGLTYRDSKDAKRAFELLDEVDRLTPNSPAAALTRVAILKDQGQTAEATKVLDALVAAAPGLDSLALRAAFLRDSNDWEGALRDYQQLLVLDTTGDAHVAVGAAYWDADRKADAVSVWQQGAEKFPKNSECRRKLMKSLLGDDDPAQQRRALDMLAQLRRELPADAELDTIAALLALQNGSPASRQEAQATLARLTEARGVPVEAYLALIPLSAAKGELNAARDLAARAEATYPDDLRVVLARGETEQLLGNHAVAREKASAVLAREPQHVGALRLALRAALASGAREVGETLLAKYRALPPPAGDKFVDFCLLELARLALDADDLAACEQFAQQAGPAAGPNSIRIRMALLGRKGQYDEVRRIVAEAGSEPDSAELRFSAAVILSGSPNAAHVNEAAAILEKLVAATPANVAARLELAAVCYRLGQYDRSEEAYRKVLDAEPNNVRALNDLAWLLCEVRRDYAAALVLADRGIQLDPDHVHLRDTRGVILSNLPGRLGDARLDFERAVRLTKPETRERAMALLQIGRLYAKQGDSERAQRSFDEALRIDQVLGVFSEEQRSEIRRLRESLGLQARRD
ncbi:MAG: Beta-barrel assembly-enhancing protease [Phycisphaerae bacterium]|nr:Beta-barrel assembly-enhancing protease [Phycisphaerae bacterium]